MTRTHHPPAEPYDFYCREPACDARAEATAPDHRAASEEARALGWDTARSLCPECADAARFVRRLKDDWDTPVSEPLREAARVRLSAVISRITGGPGPPLYLLAERLPGMLGGLEKDPSGADPWAWAIRFEMLYALAEDEVPSLSNLPGSAAERLAGAADPLEWLSSSRARWRYASRAVSRSRFEDLSEAVWDGVRLEAERALPSLLRPILDDRPGN